jgi:hypothetical protein
MSSLLRKRLCLLLLVGLLAPVLSGCASSDEPTLASAVAKSSTVEEAVEGLKADDDAAEVERLREEAPQTTEEREELRDAREQVAMEASQAAEAEEGALGAGETETAGEAEGEEN